MSNKYSEKDFWSIKAFDEGYPARSVYKLEEINKKFSILSANSNVLDLGASPGSWDCYLLRNLGSGSRILAVDLKPLDEKIRDDRLSFIQGDLTAKSIFLQVKEKAPFELVLCDAAPYTTGNKSIDVASQNALVELALYYATNMLKKGGAFVTKIFQGGELKGFVEQARSYFVEVRTFKPKSCRKNSIETYIIGKNFKP